MRRLIAFFVLLLSAYVGFEIHTSASSMLGPVFVLLAAIVAFLAGAVLVFNLRITKPGMYRDSGFGMYEPVGVGIGTLGLLIFALAPLAIAARGVYRGFLPAFGSGPDIVFSQKPVAFVLNFSVWVAIGLGVLWLLRKSVASRKKAKAQAEEDSDNAFQNTNRTPHDHRNPG